MASYVATCYDANVAAGRIERDEAQIAIVEKMTRLEQRVLEHRPARNSSALAWLFASRERAPPPIRGLYVYGEVGRGKTMLMDLFLKAARSSENAALISMNLCSTSTSAST